LGFRVRVQGSGFGVDVLGCRVECLGYRVWGRHLIGQHGGRWEKGIVTPPPLRTTIGV